MDLSVRRVIVTPIRQNCTILTNESGRAVVVDPGGESERLASELEGLYVEAILLTHGHFDHVGGAEALKAILTARQGDVVPIWGPTEEDSYLLHKVEEQAGYFGVVGLHNVTPDRYLVDGERLRLLERDIEVAHIPGHTPGHVVFIDQMAKLVIAGDTLFRHTIGRTDLARGNRQQLLNGIRTKLFTLPDEMIVLPGHGLPTTIGEERQNNPEFQTPAEL